MLTGTLTLHYLMDTTHSRLLTELVQSTTGLQTLTSDPNIKAASYIMHYTTQHPQKQLVMYTGKHMAQSLLAPPASAAFPLGGWRWLRNRQNCSLCHFAASLHLLLCLQVHHQVPHLCTTKLRTFCVAFLIRRLSNSKWSSAPHQLDLLQSTCICFGASNPLELLRYTMLQT